MRENACEAAIGSRRLQNASQWGSCGQEPGRGPRPRRANSLQQVRHCDKHMDGRAWAAGGEDVARMRRPGKEGKGGDQAGPGSQATRGGGGAERARGGTLASVAPSGSPSSISQSHSTNGAVLHQRWGGFAVPWDACPGRCHLLPERRDFRGQKRVRNGFCGILWERPRSSGGWCGVARVPPPQMGWPSCHSANQRWAVSLSPPHGTCLQAAQFKTGGAVQKNCTGVKQGVGDGVNYKGRDAVAHRHTEFNPGGNQRVSV